MVSFDMTSTTGLDTPLSSSWSTPRTAHSAVSGRRRAAQLGVVLAADTDSTTGGVRPQVARTVPTAPIMQFELDVPGPRDWSPPV